MSPVKYDLYNMPLPVALAIVKAFTGANHNALAQQYSVSARTVYQLLNLAEQGASMPGALAHTPAAPLQDDHIQQDSGQSFSSPSIDSSAE